MNERDKLEPKDVPPRGVLRRREALAPGYGRFWPPERLRPFVEHFWTVAWDLTEPETHEVLPHPSVQWVVERGSCQVVGVARGRFTRTLEGRGRVLAAKFLPGGFRPFYRRPVSDLTDRTVDAGALFGADFGAVEEQMLQESDGRAALGLLADLLVARAPEPDTQVALVGEIAERAAMDREMLRVEDLAAVFGLGVRRLQRLFSEYVGVGPKWVIQRYRLHEASERIARGDVPSWSKLAIDLGYADQAHFIRDFRRIVGRTPEDYVRSLGG